MLDFHNVLDDQSEHHEEKHESAEHRENEDEVVHIKFDEQCESSPNK
jgi:hypothetical protein